ncbi:hypothetical protein MTO96_009002 [Rhipicephalus appendiculatus]
MDSDGRGEPLPEKDDDRIQYIREFLASKDVDFDRPCTFRMDGDCWLVGTLRPWNKILSAVYLELVELRPAILCLRSNCLDSDGNRNVDAVRNGAYLFRWLPKQHACVQSICVDESRGFRNQLLVLDKVLRSSAHLRHLTLNGGYSMSYSERDLCDGMATLKTLETFEFLDLGIASRNLARGIASLLRKKRETPPLLDCQVLSELSFDRNPLNKGNIETLAVVVRSLRNLKKLTLDYSINEDAPFGPIAKVLESNGTLEELSLIDCRIQVELLFEALQTNTTLRLVDLMYCTMNLSEVMHFANALSLNKGLRTVLLQHCHLAEEGIVALANAVAVNDTLEKLDLSGYWWSAQAVMAFCRSLKNNRTPRSVVLGPMMSSDQERMELSQELSQHKCHDRIALPWEDADLTPLTMALKADAQSLQELDLPDLVTLSVSLSCSLLDALASNTTVRVLKFKSGGYDSLLVNATVVQLSLLASKIGVGTSKLVAKMLGQNRTLTTITFSSHILKGKQGEIISRGLVQNNTVTSFMSPCLSRSHASLRIREVIGRNLGLLNLAVKFVMQMDLTKRSAQAFETLRAAPSLVFQLSEVAGKSEQEALAAIEAADWYLRSHYLYLTGVVKFSVECHPSTQTQVDALNDYCWHAIAQFLTVSDVRDD